MAARYARGFAAAAGSFLLVAVAGGPVPAPARAAAGTPAFLASVSPATFVPGATLTLTGSGFGTAPDGAEVVLVGPDVAEPAAVAAVVSWTATRIVATTPATGLWPGAASVEVVSPGGVAPSNARSVTVVAPGGAVTAPEADWMPAAAGGGGGLDVGWFDAAAAPPGPLTLTLPLSTPDGGPAFSVPATLPAGSVTVDGSPASADVGSGTLSWASGAQTSADVLTVTLPQGGEPPAGPVQVAVAPTAGITATPGVYPVGIGTGEATGLASADVAPDAATAFQLSLPSQVASGVPFPVGIQAVDAAGQPVGTGPTTVYIGSSAGTLDFIGGTQVLDGPTTVSVTLQGGSGQVTAVAAVAGSVAVSARSMAGLLGTAQMYVSPPPAGSGVQVQIFPPFSGWTGGTTVYDAANIETLDVRSGVRTAGQTPAFSGWWPAGEGSGYEAEWTGVLTVHAPPALPAPLPQPALQFAFLNVAAQRGTATLAPVAGSGAAINGAALAVGISTAPAGGGPGSPTVVTLAPGRYEVTVQAQDDAPTGGAGDTLYYSEAFTEPPSATSASIFAPVGGAAAWSPLEPVPPAAFGSAGLPDPALTVSIGAATADAEGASIALPEPARIVNDYTLLPLRALTQALGAAVGWDQATGGITVALGQRSATLTVGSSAATVDGSPVTLDQPALLVPPGVTLVPLRFLGQALGWQVGWDAAASAAVLLPPLQAAPPVSP